MMEDQPREIIRPARPHRFGAVVVGAPTDRMGPRFARPRPVAAQALLRDTLVPAIRQTSRYRVFDMPKTVR